MITFKHISLKDKELILSYTLPYATYDCEYSFGNLFSWNFYNESSYAIIDQCLVVRFTMEDGSHLYLSPIGKCDKTNVIKQLDEHSRTNNEVLKIRGSLQETLDMLEQYAPKGFEYVADRDYFDYVYLRKNLVELTGKNYQPKRNHINKFKKEYNYKYTPLTPEIVPYCIELEKEWCKKRDCLNFPSLKHEHEAFCNTINNYEALGISGGAIWVDDEIVAFTLGSPINHETFDVQFEKADTDIDGAYTIINQEFASRLPEQFIYLNREEDMGMEGLRKAKLSYHPEFLVEKCIATKCT
ncbi:phosphatidylglycerol lysyltransferase domain-containing protein [Odoribacter sp. OttesenSCG-928-J03]|nr:phosphatidylglycerol lysyltransferase domain-containing protein [Odoribacter sp. OttesenSCG-928-J03]MDL2330625.1 phosphatidylglycerol lysyltransferase domain-containing protein [Odoribacter sp. OttesenSCG-928-A06]